MAMDYIAEKAKSTAKKAGKRAGEKLIRKIGGDQTRDRAFDDLNYSFQQQVAQSEKLKKDVGRYEHLIKEIRKATKGLNDILADFFEEFWPGSKEFQLCLQDQETLWNEFLRSVHRMNDPIRRYQVQFEDIKERIQKRENKLMDYDIARRSLEKAYNSDKVSDNKIKKLEDDFDDAESEYLMLNDELLHALPPVLESRGPFVVEAFSNFFTTHEVFSSETFKVQGMLREIVGALHGQRLEVMVGKERRGRGRGGGPTRSGQIGKGGGGGGGGRRAGGGGGGRDTRPGGQSTPGMGTKSRPQGMQGSYDSRPGPGGGSPARGMATDQHFVF
ncbi:bridging integrator 2-like [Ptychodera flava]|uniref:bridging integrator 2-like n=1 Tax=Ptychodera flava TaxID=63121 RepID=UPI00396A7D0A